YTFVGDGEPFYCETLQYIENLKKAGVTAQVDVYNYDIHAADMMTPWKAVSKEAIKNFNEYFSYAQKTYFAPQN
ncbi:MAG: alpha/beta hydrolase, partial [Acutalibacteraceae bacterium]